MRSEIVVRVLNHSLDPIFLRRRFAMTHHAPLRGAAIAMTLLSLLLPMTFQRAQAQTETVFYNFGSDSPDGVFPASPVIFDSAGNLYGTTYGDYDDQGYGIVFELSPNGAGGYQETTLYSFCSLANCADGASPVGPLIFDANGNLYGTTWQGGIGCCLYSTGAGVVFELSAAGGSWTYSILYSFNPGNGADGAGPRGGVVMDHDGNLYGTTYSSPGTVFELNRSPSGWTEQVIYQQQADGYAGLTMDSDGNLYGLSSGGGVTGDGYVFQLYPNDSDGWNETILHDFSFSHWWDGYSPVGTPVLDSAGNLYGQTSRGGANFYGSVWKLIPFTTGKDGGTIYRERILHSFTAKDGSYPAEGVVLDSSGNIFGTTYSGGKYGLGTVFELALSGKSYKYKTLLNFNSTNGASPLANPILDSSGNLYGTTWAGGNGGYGTVFELIP